MQVSTREHAEQDGQPLTLGDHDSKVGDSIPVGISSVRHQMSCTDSLVMHNSKVLAHLVHSSPGTTAKMAMSFSRYQFLCFPPEASSHYGIGRGAVGHPRCSIQL